MTILEEANSLVNGPRQADYGIPYDNFTDIARLWSVVLKTHVTAEQAALCMVLLKVAREIQKPQRDNRVDGAGYFAVLDLIVAERERSAAEAREQVGRRLSEVR